ncbi:putative disease resistance protein RGA3 [Silene latifolia]|uniref:putative disease resistance protein RGA3 n=1 Tax=Silene latifolia TaxID=37657 RepID=UPI003D77D24F
MAEAAAISLATDAAKAMGQLLMDRTIDEMKLMWGLKDELEKLKSKFSNLQLFLKDIGSAKHADKRGQVNDWVLKVKDAVYVADDIMDDYDYEIIRREREQKKQFRGFFSRNNNPIVFRIRMSHRVRDALAMFDELDKNAQNMGLKQVEITKDGITGMSSNNEEGSDRLSQARQHAAANPNEFVGRKDEMKKLLEIMCSPSNEEAHISTVAILGLGGLGKTTFARCIYDSRDIDAHFEKKLWISVSDNFNIPRILNEMLEYVTSKKGDLSNIDAIINKLQEKLKNKKYLLVLDDVWCKDQELWSSLKNALQRIGGLPGCLILITTRLIEVTTRSRAVYTHLLRELSEEEGWALLKQRVSVGGTSPNFSILEEIGKKIVEKCKGVPLAIKAIGGILQSKQLPHEWELIEKSEIWDLPQNDENQILPSLRLTFDHLPSPSLKQCFAYCAAFCPRGYTMEKDELVAIWLAQGFLHGSEIKNLTMEEIGEKYLMVLLNYSLLDEVKGKEPGYKMHDLVYDLAVDVSGKDLLLWKPKDNQKIDRCRHLVMSNKKDVEALSNIPITKTLIKLRTISYGLPHNVLIHAKYLRTLSVDACDIKELPSSIGLLKHLRFLSVSYNPIQTLPDSIGKLYLLETLRLLGCYDMEVLPAILYRLTNLIHIPTTTLMLASRGLVELTNLHTLPCLALGDDEDGWSIDELGGLHKLMGEIHISGLERVKTKENARKADLAGKAKVSNITLAWASRRDEISGGSNDEDVLDGLQPHPNITSLELKNFFGLTLPSWMLRMAVVSEGGSSPSLLKNLTSLKLVNCRRCRVLPTLGHLPCLKYLFLSELKVEIIGSDFYVVPLSENSNKVNRVSFPSLTELEISEFDSLKTWVLPSTGEETIVFPLLDVIKLTNCPELENFPALDYFQSLKTLQLYKVGVQSLEITKQNPSSMLSPEVNLKLETLKIDNCEKLVSIPRELQFDAPLKTMIVKSCPALTSVSNLFTGRGEKRASLATFTIEGRTPDFSNSSVNHVSFPSLIELQITGCKALKTCVLPPSADATNVFPRLEVLQVVNCPELETLPTLNSQSLKKVEIKNLGIRSFSIASPTANMKLEILEISDCEKLVSLPSELQFAASLKTMKVTGCPALTSFPNDLFQGLVSLSELSIYRCEKLVSLPSSLQFAASLKTMKVTDCPALTSFPNDLFQGLVSLSELSIYRCQQLVSLPSELQFVASLKTVEVTNCPALTSLPNDLFNGLTSLSQLTIERCEALSNIPTSLEKCVSLAKLTILDCHALTSLPNELFNGLASLSDLRIDSCKALSNIPTSLEECVSLATLAIEDCPSINGPTPDFSKLKGLQQLHKRGNPIELMISMLKAIEHLPELTTLRTGGFSDEEEQELYFSDVSPILQNQSLRELYLYGSPNIKSLPEQLQLLTQIKSLWIWDFDDVEELPEWVGRLSSLEELELALCEKLKEIPSKEVFLQMTRLRKLRILCCPILGESCVKDVGSDWTKISHIPSIYMDGYDGKKFAFVRLTLLVLFLSWECQ